MDTSHLKILNSGVTAWNKWREDNPDIIPDLGGANLRDADLRYANLRGASLGGANLRGANLGDANLGYANLVNANLGYANLRGADLGGANLRGANLGGINCNADTKGLNKYLTTHLYSMLDQNSTITAYKIVNADGYGIHKPTIKYVIGKEITVNEWDDCEFTKCGAGINLADSSWVLNNISLDAGHKILLVEFNKEDIVCIPIGSDGKFRVKRCKVIAEKDPKELELCAA